MYARVKGDTSSSTILMEEKSGLEVKVDPCNPPKKDYNRLLEKVRRDIAQHEKEVDENTNRLKAL